MKTINTYLGQKGYTIPKNQLSIEQEKQIRTDLTIKPHVHGASGFNSQTTFPAYRESNNKMYVPHYYGAENFGKPAEIKINEGDDINIEFNGKLRDQQEVVVKTYIDHVEKCKYGGGLLELPCAYGKCLRMNTPIIMFDGTIKMVQDIKVGDQLMGDDSTARNVLSLARGKETMYRVLPMDGTNGSGTNGSGTNGSGTNGSGTNGGGYVVNESHILSLKCVSNCDPNMRKGQIVDISVLDYLNYKGDVLYGYRVPIYFEEKPLPMDPYTIGYWLGNKSYQSNKIITNTFLVKLTDLNLINNKHIPLLYKCNSRVNRMKLLAGLIDSDGQLFNNSVFKLTQKSETLVDDIIYLVRSLGFACYKKRTQPFWIYKCRRNCEPDFKITISGNGIEDIPILVPNKKPFRKPFEKGQMVDNVLNYKIKLEKLGVEDYYGFEIDGNRRFVLGDFTVTHNTVLSLNIISQLKKKTFIIVHKEFLMNQWIERINQFLPKARIGKIQGQIIDIDDKDIVIGMLQSLSMKDYPAAIFDSFGLTIIDEVHHISSEVFSNTLFKVVTKYMLGLSATMERKDGTTKVFKMFLGDVVFKGKREEEMNVIVRAIEYNVNDEEFNEVKTDFRGNTAHSSMISKLCEYNRRSEFILTVLSDMLLENPAQQVMILAHNKNILKYLHDAIQHRNIATVGYYVGGMKESALKETEGKKVVIATYAMAAEALDIKTLTTLIMATPKTDIEQSVGRILREKHSSPVVVDIIDSHFNFKNQWKKRKTFYKKENYKIIYTTNTKYSTDTDKWDVIFEPKTNRTLCAKTVTKKATSLKSVSSNDKSITTDSDSESDEHETVDEPKDKLLCGKCLITIKK